MRDWTIEVYKKDRRFKTGETLIQKKEYKSKILAEMRNEMRFLVKSNSALRYELHKTYVTRTNILDGTEFQERYDTPRVCSPSSELFWSF